MKPISFKFVCFWGVMALFALGIPALYLIDMKLSNTVLLKDSINNLLSLYDSALRYSDVIIMHLDSVFYELETMDIVVNNL